ncbi:MAG: hypothetical protein PHR90_03690 [Sphaerochaetaceae bacterium]|nr:hypothetical protein [Sphaerochaetaceae bacterium]
MEPFLLTAMTVACVRCQKSSSLSVFPMAPESSRTAHSNVKNGLLAVKRSVESISVRVISNSSR